MVLDELFKLEKIPQYLGQMIYLKPIPSYKIHCNMSGWALAQFPQRCVRGSLIVV